MDPHKASTLLSLFYGTPILLTSLVAIGLSSLWLRRPRTPRWPACVLLLANLLSIVACVGFALSQVLSLVWMGYLAAAIAILVAVDLGRRSRQVYRTIQLAGDGR